MAPGTLFLVVGPSGAGKNTLIDGARRSLEGDARFVFAGRSVTRPDHAPGDMAMAPDDFEAARQRGAFALTWHAHGLAYGVPRDISRPLEEGRCVIANVSRSVITEARKVFPRIRVIHVDAPATLLRQRLAGRAREPADDQEERLRRTIPVEGDDVEFLVNDGPIDHAIDAMVRILRRG
ncbi:MAG: phosphonate metabolism protein/1,5-bisphosphokinase (PRPP-forming) PhnN [bacterium]|nr:phosphonate metabolism protein/1,5-bisphosphokinase (PRPP-forming) PhnN [bacterium]MDE0238923.1 phosphonate metabolism protein/1,5-bisphosphokinase (PRPP-forming) PhnN [bacterium]